MNEANDRKIHLSSEELSALALGELTGERQTVAEDHVVDCAECRERFGALRALEAALGALPGFEPPAAAVLETRRAVNAAVRGAAEPEVLTLPEVAGILRVDMAQLRYVMDDLPVFELAGQIRVRRSKLIEWIEEREGAYERRRIESQVAGILAGVERMTS